MESWLIFLSRFLTITSVPYDMAHINSLYIVAIWYGQYVIIWGHESLMMSGHQNDRYEIPKWPLFKMTVVQIDR